MIIFLNRLKIVENIPKRMKKLNKTSMIKAMGPFQKFTGSPGSGPALKVDIYSFRLNFFFLKQNDTIVHGELAKVYCVKMQALITESCF